MSALPQLLVTNAALAGLLALTAWVASRRLERPGVVHALWLLSLVKLLTPPLLELRVLSAPAAAVAKAVRPLAPVARSTSAPRPAPIQTGTPRPGAALPPEPAVRARAISRPPSPRPAPALAPLTLPAPGPALAAFLVLGAIGVAGLSTLRLARFRRVLATAEPAPPGLVERAAELAARLGVRRVPEVCLVAARVPPMLWPAGPRLLFPRDLLPELTPGEQDALLAHELAHVRRRDHWVRFLEIGATALFWWYPVTWWARRGLRRAEERCCDEWVLRALPDAAEPYAHGILKSLAFLAPAPEPIPDAASGAGPVHDLESRLKEILMTRPRPRLPRAARFLLGLAALAGLALFPTVAPPSTARAASVAFSETDDATPRPQLGASSSLLATTPAAAVAGSPAPASAPLALSGRAATPPPSLPSAFLRTRPMALGALAPSSEGGDEPRDPALEAEHRALEDRRRELQLAQLDLEKRSLELDLKRSQKETASDVARLKAEGDAAGAARAEKDGSLQLRRLDLERRRLELQVQDVRLEAEAERLEREAGNAGPGAKGDEERRKLEGSVREVEKKREALEKESESLEAQVRLLEAEIRVHELRVATADLERSLADQIQELREALADAPAQKGELEREISRLEAALAALQGNGKPGGATR